MSKSADILAAGRYQVLRRLAQGGMGEVLLAEFPGDTHLGITKGLVVVKRVLQDVPHREHQCRMLREEARLSLRLLHENLVESYFLDEHEGDPLLVMEYLSGRSLAQILGHAKKSKALLPVDVVLAVMRAAACGLHFAHTLSDDGKPLGLIHRDVSPANVFVAFDGRSKVIDFGVAKAKDSELRTATGILKGKLGYMSPEHAEGDIVLTPATDMWSLGVVMWECLCAERLFSNPSPADTLKAIADGEIPSPASVRPGIPAAVVDICMGLLTRDLSRRIGSGAALVAAIDAAFAGIDSVRVDNHLAQRFPEDAALAEAEDALRARMQRAAPVPHGLAVGTSSVAPDAGVVPTLVLRAPSRATLMDELQDASAASSAMTAEDVASPTKRFSREANLVSAPPPAAEPETARVSPDALAAARARDSGPSPAAPAAPAAPVAPAAAAAPVPAPAPVNGPTRNPTRARKRRKTSWLSVGLASFGGVVTCMGLALSMLTPVSAPREVYAFVDGNSEVFVVHAADAVPGAVVRAVAVSSPTLAREVSPADTAAFRQAFAASDVVARAALPEGRAKIAALLPVVLVSLGVFGVLVGGAGLLTSRRLLVALAALLSTFAVTAMIKLGVLSWPGTDAFQRKPTFLWPVR